MTAANLGICSQDQDQDEVMFFQQLSPRPIVVEAAACLNDLELGGLTQSIKLVCIRPQVIYR